jgi:hypothetical protein
MPESEVDIKPCKNCSHLVRSINRGPYEHVRDNPTDQFCETPRPVAEEQ